MSLIAQHDLDCDVLVAGGGPAGVPAALAAARGGARVILVQNRHVLGGNASSEVKMHIVGADGARGTVLATEAREGGIIEEIRLETCVTNGQRAASMLDLVLYDLCRTEPNLTLMLNTEVVGAEVQDGKIVAVQANRESTEDHFRITARVFIDCTGDGRLGAEAGAPFRRGREGVDEYGEKLAQPVADSKSLGSTLLFTATKHNRPMPFKAPSWVRKFSEDDLKFRHHAKAGIDQGPEYGYWWCEWGGELDTIKDNEMIRDELMAIMLGVWDHIKNTGDHGAENWALNWFSFLPGKRESRRFVGQYVISERDVMESVPHADAIAFGGWPIDTHPPKGVDAKDEKPCNQINSPYVFDIPLRACVSRDVPNLLFAGRNISATHIAFASTRVMATCAVMGQGVGTTAAWAVAHNRLPGDLTTDSAAITAIQQQLLRDDCYLIGVNNTDAADVARRATVKASSEQADGPAAAVLSGQTRAIFGKAGAPPGRAVVGTHRWMSEPAAGLPAWLELHWDRPVTPTRVELVFDTGMHRKLTLSHSDYYSALMQWGQAQTETIRDYTIAACDGTAWQTLHTVAGNYQRKRNHVATAAFPTTALRIAVSATNGLDHARLLEVRVYES